MAGESAYWIAPWCSHRWRPLSDGWTVIRTLALALALAAGVGLWGTDNAWANTTTTASFTTPGIYFFTVPVGITSIQVQATGAAGGSDIYTCPGVGGMGATVSATLAVSAGQQLQVGVGGEGGAGACGQGSGGAGGVGGGGSGGSAQVSIAGAGPGAGGGGASWFGMFFPGSSELVVAGGGGGAGGVDGGDGGNAGMPGGPPSSGSAGAGGAGTATGGGAGGVGDTCGNASAGQAGSFAAGGAGGSGFNNTNGGVGGGGAGGGYYGGGGGGGSCLNNSGGGGGGGSSYTGESASSVTGPSVTPNAAEVQLTYAAPTADLSTQAISFTGTQPLGIPSPEQDVTVTNNGSAPLVVTDTTLAGANPGAYLLEDACQSPVNPGSSCAIGVRFDPESQGPSSATLTLLTNAPTQPAPISLSGQAGSEPQGPSGPAGTTGSAGLPGAQGATGAQGLAGGNGVIELLSCAQVKKVVFKTIGGHRKRVTITTQICTTKTISGSVTFTTTSLPRVSLSRHGVVYASGIETFGSPRLTLTVTSDHELPRGKYTLTLRTRADRAGRVTRRTLTLC
ncbi:MAG TPA: choice-of-anchor D domain-containing protein [Solirubrobacteraceae bacterium]|nr:choice-of-anchor D domain-containing protein [Solirubrobacteraceae bacterium]